MFYRLKVQVRRIRFAGECKGVLRSAPVALDASSSLALLSQLQHKDVLVFLLALKSFTRQIEPRAVYVVNDGSLDGDDCNVLAERYPVLDPHLYAMSQKERNGSKSQRLEPR
jgi:hypothetical protein